MGLYFKCNSDPPLESTLIKVADDPDRCNNSDGLIVPIPTLPPVALIIRSPEPTL